MRHVHVLCGCPAKNGRIVARRPPQVNVIVPRVPAAPGHVDPSLQLAFSGKALARVEIELHGLRDVLISLGQLERIRPRGQLRLEGPIDVEGAVGLEQIPFRAIVTPVHDRDGSVRDGERRFRDRQGARDPGSVAVRVPQQDPHRGGLTGAGIEDPNRQRGLAARASAINEAEHKKCCKSEPPNRKRHETSRGFQRDFHFHHWAIDSHGKLLTALSESP